MKRTPDQKKLFIHIGAHKTGTTAIQSFLALNRKTLRKAGVLYPGDSDNHYKISLEISELDNPLIDSSSQLFQVIQQIKTEYPGFHTVILSTEGFWEIVKEKSINMFREALLMTGIEFDIEIIFYCRRQDTWLESAYQQHVKQINMRISRTFQEFLERKTLFKTIEYFNRLENWARVFGRGSIRVNVYSRDTDIVDSFGYYVGILPGINVEKPPLSKSNMGLRPASIEFVRLLNLLGVEDKDFVKAVKHLAALEYKPIGNYNFLNPHDQVYIMDYFNQQNVKLAQAYLNKDNLFEDQGHITEGQNIDQSGINHVWLESVLSYLYSEDKALIYRLYRHISRLNQAEKPKVDAINAFLKQLNTMLLPHEVDEAKRNVLFLWDDKGEIPDDFCVLPEFFMLNYKNFLKNIRHASNDISTILIENEEIVLISSGNDPYFVLKPVKKKITGDLVFRIDISVPAKTSLQLFYQTFKNVEFAQERSVAGWLMPGDNLLYIKVVNNGLNGVFRIDPGSVEGKYFLKGLDIRQIV